jgi:small subunit ribosomal protein S24e
MGAGFQRVSLKVNHVKIKVINNQRNELLKRNEVKFSVDHVEAGTPSRAEVKQKLAANLDVDAQKIIIKKYKTKTGSMVAEGEANVYDSAEQANKTEPKYIIKRNIPKTEKKEQKEQK